MTDHFRMAADQRAALFAKYGLNKDDEVLVNYDIIMKQARNTKGSPQGGTP